MYDRVHLKAAQHSEVSPYRKKSGEKISPPIITISLLTNLITNLVDGVRITLTIFSRKQIAGLALLGTSHSNGLFYSCAMSNTVGRLVLRPRPKFAYIIRNTPAELLLPHEKSEVTARVLNLLGTVGLLLIQVFVTHERFFKVTIGGL